MKKILAADIGGTNSRFGYFQLDDQGILDLIETQWLETQASTSFPHLLDQLRALEFSLLPDKSDFTVFAIAGPVEDGTRSAPPNISWDVDLSAIDEYETNTCRLINDFVAQAFACRSPIIESAQQVVPGRICPQAPLAVIGAGTGLGQAALIPDGTGGFLAIPSEGGHSSFPFETQDEVDYMQFLLKVYNARYVETEFVVSGRGLSCIYQYLTGESHEPSEVAARLAPDSDALRWMSRFLGRLCRNYALQVMAGGGVYLTGGVVAKIPELVTHTDFTNEFRTSKTMAHLLEKIPVFLNTNEQSGLWGAAMVAKQELRRQK